MRATKARRIRHQAVRIIRDNPQADRDAKTLARQMRRAAAKNRPAFINGYRVKLWGEK